MKKLTSLFIAPALALSAGLVLGACLFDKEKESDHREFRFTGKLADLDTVASTTGWEREWYLPLDSGEALEMKGDCLFVGYLGDSIAVTNNEVAALYTNDLMQGTRMAERWREYGANLSADSAHLALTHYRADFECKD